MKKILTLIFTILSLTVSAKAVDLVQIVAANTPGVNVVSPAGVIPGSVLGGGSTSYIGNPGSIAILQDPQNAIVYVNKIVAGNGWLPSLSGGQYNMMTYYDSTTYAPGAVTASFLGFDKLHDRPNGTALDFGMLIWHFVSGSTVATSGHDFAIVGVSSDVITSSGGVGGMEGKAIGQGFGTYWGMMGMAQMQAAPVIGSSSTFNSFIARANGFGMDGATPVSTGIYKAFHGEIVPGFDPNQKWFCFQEDPIEMSKFQRAIIIGDTETPQGMLTIATRAATIQPMIVASTGSTKVFELTSASATFQVPIFDGVTGLTIPDYVFDANYNLMPLAELRDYLNENHHLPDIPNAGIVNDNFNREGEVYTRDLTLALLKKTEETNLYILGLDDRISALEHKQ